MIQDLYNYYFENKDGGYGASTVKPDPQQIKKLITKEEYDAARTQYQEDQFSRRIMTDQMKSAQELALQAEKDEIIAAIATATGLTIEQLKKVL